MWGFDWDANGERFLVCSQPDGAAEAPARSAVSVRNAEDGAVLSTFYPGGHQPYCCAFSPDHRYVAAAGGRTDRGGKPSRKNCTVHLWDLHTGELAATLSGHTQLVRSVAFTGDSKGLISGGQDRTLRFWIIEDALSAQ